jgi:hypothetical protein
LKQDGSGPNRSAITGGASIFLQSGIGDEAPQPLPDAGFQSVVDEDKRSESLNILSQVTPAAMFASPYHSGRVSTRTPPLNGKMPLVHYENLVAHAFL